MHIKNWSARRSGPSITVKGRGEGSAAVSLTDVRLIELRGRLVVAVQSDGNETILSTEHGAVSSDLQPVFLTREERSTVARLCDWGERNTSGPPEAAEHTEKHKQLLRGIAEKATAKR